MLWQEASHSRIRIPERLIRLSVCSKLASRGISHRFRKMAVRSHRLRALTITVTRRCNSRCTMCNIWRLGRDREELSLEEITKFLASPSLGDLVELDLTGGEPFLRPDLPVLIERVCAQKKGNLRSLKTIALATNGLLPRLIAEKVKKILLAIDGRLDLALVCSLDGIGECHDLTRGVPGAYSKVRETIQRLGELASTDPVFRLGMKTTILPWNWEHIPSLIRFAKEHGLFHVLSPVLFTAERFRNLEQQSQLDVVTRDHFQLVDLYSSAELAEDYFSFVVVDTLRHGGRRIPCSAGTAHVFVEGDGRIFPCPPVAITLGDIRATAPEDLLSSPDSRKAVRMVGRLPQCKWCLEPGCIRFSQATEGLGFLRFIMGRQGADRFRRAYYGEGLYKYF